MCNNNVAELFADGRIVFPGKEIDAAKLPWRCHPSEGVLLKDLVTGADTDGAFSCHIVWVKKGSSVGEHDHKVEWEFNEVLAGSGTMIVSGKEMACRPGLSYVTPPKVAHVVSAPREDLFMTARFVPALR
jgi:mannose-6-phosphate isomerase-like protein (cupin superfamily)